MAETMQMKLVFLDTKTIGIIPNQRLLDKFGEVVYYETTEPDQTSERIREADIVITNKVVLNQEIIEGAKRLKLICVAATGTNNVDKAAAMKAEIPVKNVSDYSTNSVAQGTFALLLHLVNKIGYYDQYVKQGHYCSSDIFTHYGSPFFELTGKRFGILGLGNIGRQVARIATAFGTEVVYYSASGQNTHQPYKRLELEEFLSTSDIISIHAPLNDYTLNLINYDRLRMMKRSAILLNAGRGGIVNERDLARALNEDLISGACIDVFSKEPILPDNPLLHINNPEKIVLTPHVTWASVEARTLLMEKVCKNIEEFIEDKTPIKS